MDDQVADISVPGPQVEREFGVSSMTIWRWDRDSKLGFPPKIKINGRNYRSRQQLEAFKANLLAAALKAR
jgi:predicted DNA-binding transcriptional regulator AlpA